MWTRQHEAFMPIKATTTLSAVFSKCKKKKKTATVVHDAKVAKVICFQRFSSTLKAKYWQCSQGTVWMLACVIQELHNGPSALHFLLGINDRYANKGKNKNKSTVSGQTKSCAACRGEVKYICLHRLTQSSGIWNTASEQCWAEL